LQTSIDFQRFNFMQHDVILFDGMCNLCSSSVQFVLRRDASAHFKFASLQSEYAENVIRNSAMTSLPNSVVLVTSAGEVYTESGAAIRIAQHLGGFWPLMRIFLVVPAFVRNAVYQLVARNRYRMFGKSDTCWLPDAKWKERFLG
jgi:predicted DCC family thiol-disulfide oxidoreductase YuxK